MRFATLKRPSTIALGFGVARNPWILWTEIQKAFPSEKVIQDIENLQVLVQRSSFVLPWLLHKKSEIAALKGVHLSRDDFDLPLRPLLFRDFYAFEEHVKKSRSSRGLQMIPEWYEAPVFYYSNPFSFKGPFEPLPFPHGVTELDCEMEIACIVGRDLLNASLAEARDAIFGYSLLNDWSARNIQRFEMKMNMGPTKAKDFATTLGTYIITADEIERYRQNKGFHIQYEWRLNGETMRRNSWDNIQFSFEEMLVRASQNCRIYAGEIVASGTLGGGCLFESNPPQRWLQKGDRVEMEWLNDGPEIDVDIRAENL